MMQCYDTVMPCDDTVTPPLPRGRGRRSSWPPFTPFTPGQEPGADTQILVTRPRIQSDCVSEVRDQLITRVLEQCAHHPCVRANCYKCPCLMRLMMTR